MTIFAFPPNPICALRSLQKNFPKRALFASDTLSEVCQITIIYKAIDRSVIDIAKTPILEMKGSSQE